MIVQRRGETLRIIAQHDHALLSGRMASAWRGGSGRRLGFDLVLAVTVHDLGWQRADVRPLYDPASGEPFDFVGFPQGDRIALYARAIDEVERISPFAALLTSLHYEKLLGGGAPESYRAAEQTRRQRIREGGVVLADGAALEEALAHLRFFDVLSLYVCMATPGAETEALPRWLDPAIFARGADGRRFSMAWEGEDRLIMDPFPFEEALTVRLPFLTLDRRSYGSKEALASAWDRAQRGVWEVVVAKKGR